MNYFRCKKEKECGDVQEVLYGLRRLYGCAPEMQYGSRRLVWHRSGRMPGSAQEVLCKSGMVLVGVGQEGCMGPWGAHGRRWTTRSGRTCGEVV